GPCARETRPGSRADFGEHRLANRGYRWWCRSGTHSRRCGYIPNKRQFRLTIPPAGSYPFAPLLSCFGGHTMGDVGLRPSIPSAPVGPAARASVAEAVAPARHAPAPPEVAASEAPQNAPAPEDVSHAVATRAHAGAISSMGFQNLPVASADD